MRTTQEMLNFLNTHKIGSIEAPKHVPLIEQSLMPNEEVLFVFCGNQNSQGIQSQGLHVYALTNQRFLVAQGKSFTSSRNTRMTETYTYDQIGNITFSRGLLTGTITIAFYTGVGSIMVEKKQVEFIYNSLNQSLFSAKNQVKLAVPPPPPSINDTPHTGNKFCTSCGTRLASDSMFCSSCGTKQV